MNRTLTDGVARLATWGARYPGWLASGGALLTCLLSTPSWWQMLQGNSIILGNWEAITWQSQHLLEPLPYPPEDHNGQILYRILIPGLMRLTGLPVWVMLLGQYALGIVFLRQLWLWGRDQWGTVSGALLWLAWLLSYPVKGYFVDVRGYFDGVAWFLLWRVFRANRPWEAALFAFMATQVDERAYLVLCFLGVHHLMGGGHSRVGVSLFHTPRASMFKAGAIVLGVVGGLAVRAYGRWGLGLAVESGDTYGLGMATLRETLSLGPLPLISGLDLAFWLLPIPAWVAWRQGQRFWPAVWMGGLVASLLALSLVLDGTRSFAYLGIVALVGVVWMPRWLGEQGIRTAAWCLAIGALSLPTLFTVGAGVLWIGPIVIKALMR